MVIRSGGEHGWSFFRTNRVFQAPNAAARFVSAASRSNESRQNQATAGHGMDRQLLKEKPKAMGGPKEPRLTRGFPMWAYQFSRRQKLAAVPKEIFEHAVQDNTHMPTTAGVIQRQCMQKSSTAVHLVTAGFFRPRPSIDRVIRRAAPAAFSPCSC